MLKALKWLVGRAGRLVRPLWVRLALWFAFIASTTIVLSFVTVLLVWSTREDAAFEALDPATQEIILEINELVSDLTNEAEQTLSYINDFALVVMIMALLVAGLVAAWIARLIARPVSRLAKAVKSFEGGDFSVRVPEKNGAGELRDLSAGFNSMADSLERSEKQLRDNTAAIAHELRTPVTVLNFKLRAMLDGVLERGDDELTSCLAQTELLTRIIDDLRTISLASTGHLSLTLQEVDLADLVRLIMRDQAEQLAGAGLSLDMDLHSAPVRIDIDRMRQALLNIVENARRYAAQGGELRIATSRKASQAVIEIMDRGPGLPDSFAPAALDPFSRVEASRSREFGGSGLGLSVVASIVGAHHGKVDLQPRENGGLIVRLLLPVDHTADTPD